MDMLGSIVSSHNQGWKATHRPARLSHTLWILAAFPSACPCALLSFPGKLPKKVPSRRKPQPGSFQVGPPPLLHPPPHTSIPPQCPTQNPASWPVALAMQQTDPYHHTGFISPENHREKS